MTPTRPAATATQRTGTLFLVVGPSGVGKDSLLTAARRHFSGEPNYLFPPRVITRSADPLGEAHIPMTVGDFDTHATAGEFVLHWQAHGLRYGIPKAMHHAIANGQHVIINVSRTVLDQARRQFTRVVVLSINARPEVLARRLHTRGRETGDAVEARLIRASLSRPAGNDVVEIDNSGDLSESAAAFIAAIEAHSKALATQS